MNLNAFSWAEIDLAALRHNLSVVRAHVKRSGAEVLAVVKADAYGHGMLPVARALRKEGVRFFGVASLAEAQTLRQVCRNERILVLGSFSPGQVKDFIAARVTPTLSSWEDARLFERALARSKKRFPVHVKVDTGMGRLGAWHETAGPFFKKLRTARHLDVEGLYTHFASADADSVRTRLQARHFSNALAEARALGLRPRLVHASNSMGLSRFKDLHFDLVRPGIVLYGIDPAPGHKLSARLKPVMSLRTRAAFVKTVGKGRTLSYGATYRTTRSTRIATLPIGYSHGYRVAFSNRGHVLIRGRQYPVVGRVTMDQTLVDIGPSGPVKRWDTVTLLGRDGRAVIRAEELAHSAGTIPYEIVCAVHPRIPRTYKALRS